MRATNVTLVRYRSYITDSSLQARGLRRKRLLPPSLWIPGGLHDGGRGPVHATCPFSPRVCHSVPLDPHMQINERIFQLSNSYITN